MSHLPNVKTSHEPPRPADLRARYTTPGGSWVDVCGPDGKYTGHQWKCLGCKDGSSFPDCGPLDTMRPAAAKHAANCQAIHLG